MFSPKESRRCSRELLSDIPLFNGLADSVTDQLLAASRVVSIPAHTQIFSVQSPVKEAFVLVRGTLRRSTRLAGEVEKTLELIQSPQLLAPGEVFGAERYTSQCESLGSSLILVIDAWRLRAIVQQDLPLSDRLIQLLALRLRSTECDVTSYHYGLSATQRVLDYLLAQGGEALKSAGETPVTLRPSKKMIAARLGITPESFSRCLRELIDLGLIVVDEEHDPSFKQQDGMRYSARDVAVFRAWQRGVPIVLGSATPSLETWANATGEGIPRRYTLLTLADRANAAASLPPVRLLDTRREKLQDGLSAALLAALQVRLERGEQSLVFLNRRGYAPVLACPSCGWISRCRRCAANLVLHLADRRLRCHHCGFENGIPRACPSCGNQDIHPFGRGTQRLETTLQERFPEARILRVDRDSAKSRKQWEALAEKIHAGEADILVGTQMLAKGHDFPRLTLVGVTGADAALFAADWRAPERLFAQLMQVGGRAGRAELPGEVLIQTEHPEHPLYGALQQHDFAAFAASQLEERRSAGFPPYSYQVMLRAEAPEMGPALEYLAQARALGADLNGNGPVLLYDPVPMRMARRANLERAQLLAESTSRPALQAFLAEWRPLLEGIKAPSRLRWHLEVDPLEF